MTKVILKYTLVFVISNLLCSMLLIKWLGTVGPALSTVLCDYVTIGLYILTIRRATGLSWRRSCPTGIWPAYWVSPCFPAR